MLLQSFEPIHGGFLCEGEDIDPSPYEAELSEFSKDDWKRLNYFMQVMLPSTKRKIRGVKAC